MLREFRTGCFTEKLTMTNSSSVTCHDRRVTTSLFRIRLGQIPVNEAKTENKTQFCRATNKFPHRHNLKLNDSHSCYGNKQDWTPKKQNRFTLHLCLQLFFMCIFCRVISTSHYKTKTNRPAVSH